MSNGPTRESRQNLTLDDLSVLCDQMVALSAAGVPLDLGLIQLSQELPGRLSKHTEELGLKLQSGQTLADAVASESTGTGAFPAVYTSIVEAGIRSGKLTLALEGFSRLARHLTEVRRLVLSSLVYPIGLLLLLFMISISLIPLFGQCMRAALNDLRPRSFGGDRLSQLMDYYVTWTQLFWILPFLVFCLAVFWFIATRFAGSTGKRGDWLSWVPGAGGLLRNSRLQAFAEILSLLVRQQIPMHNALRLAGDASGDPRLAADAETLAAQIERGETDEPKPGLVKRKAGIPVLLQWSLLNASQTGGLEASLQRTAETYQRRTLSSVYWLRRTLPFVFTLSLGGVVAVFYAVTVFVPWYAVQQALSVSLESM